MEFLNIDTSLLLIFIGKSSFEEEEEEGEETMI